MNNFQMTFRDEPRPEDAGAVEKLAAESGFFNSEEVAIARELVEERLAKGLASGYWFLFAEKDERLLGYSCYGPIAGTAASWDLFWIVVDRSLRGQRIGGQILGETERRAAKGGAARLYVETSSRDQYKPTREFYLAKGYEIQAALPDFYAPGDDKMILVKRLA
jgi:GNAT superfamily N-acetyltransferase